MSRHTASLMLLLALAACGGGKQGPATQASAPFDPKGSDEKAVAIATEVMTAVGGEANMAKAKEIVWTEVGVVDGVAKGIREHAWDRWNARHQYVLYDDQGAVRKTAHDLFGDYAFAVHGKEEILKAELPKLVEDAKTRFYMDSYPLMLPHKLKDPGVHLKYAEERPEEGSAQGSPMKYDVIKLTFDPTAGPNAGDAYYVVVDKATHLPAIVERVAAGKSDDQRSGYRIVDWKEAGGLKFPAARITLGYGDEKSEKVTPSVIAAWKTILKDPLPQVPAKAEVVLITNVAVNAEPDDLLYVKPVSPDRI